jgi:pyruvate formate lyase activating enzyme
LRIGGIVDMSTVDWYGNVSLIIFFSGCNFRCPYCQNSGLIPLESGEEVDIELIGERIRIGRQLLDAVVFTGGEPLLQPKALMEAGELVKGFGLKLMIDTNGSIPSSMEPLLKADLVDRVALDVKAPMTPEDYKRVAGLRVDGKTVVEGIKRTIDICEERGVTIEARTTIAPTISDGNEFVRRIASNITNHCDVYYLQQFDNTGEVLSPEIKALEPPSRRKMMELAEIAIQEGVKNVYIKTRKDGLERVK